jgi:hypothetical protein
MVDKVLGAFLIGLVAVVFLAPMPRPVKADGYVIIAMVASVFFVRDRWLQMFLGATLLSYLIAPRTAVSARTMVTISISALLIENLIWVKIRTLILAITGVMIIAVVYASFYTAKLGIPMFVPLDNPVLAGPMYAIAAGLAWTLSPTLGIILAGAAIMSRSTTAMICLLAVFSPLLWDNVHRGWIWAIQGILALLFVRFVDFSHLFDERLQMIATTADLGRAEPFGYGLGSFIQIMPKTLGFVLDGKLWGHAHNDLLQHFMESGWTAFIVGVCFIFWHLSRYGKWERDNRMYYGAMTASIVFVLLGFPFHFAPSAIMIAIVYSIYRRCVYA